MTIDERHEALTQTVELLTIDVRQLAETAREVTRGILALADIVRSHEARISKLESL